MKCGFFAAILAAITCAPIAHARDGDPYANESPARRDARMGWWREAKFGIYYSKAQDWTNPGGAKPGIVHNNRLGSGYKGGIETPEQHIPAAGYPGRDWETCMTMNDNLGVQER